MDGIVLPPSSEQPQTQTQQTSQPFVIRQLSHSKNKSSGAGRRLSQLAKLSAVSEFGQQLMYEHSQQKQLHDIEISNAENNRSPEIGPLKIDIADIDSFNVHHTNQNQSFGRTITHTHTQQSTAATAAAATNTQNEWESGLIDALNLSNVPSGSIGGGSGGGGSGVPGGVGGGNTLGNSLTPRVNSKASKSNQMPRKQVHPSLSVSFAKLQNKINSINCFLFWFCVFNFVRYILCFEM